MQIRISSVENFVRIWNHIGNQIILGCIITNNVKHAVYTQIKVSIETNLTTSIKIIRTKKREFRKRKRQANIIWKEEKYEDIKEAAEIDIGEFYRTVRKMKKTG